MGGEGYVAICYISGKYLDLFLRGHLVKWQSWEWFTPFPLVLRHLKWKVWFPRQDCCKITISHMPMMVPGPRGVLYVTIYFLYICRMMWNFMSQLENQMTGSWPTFHICFSGMKDCAWKFKHDVAEGRVCVCLSSFIFSFHFLEAAVILSLWYWVSGTSIKWDESSAESYNWTSKRCSRWNMFEVNLKWLFWVKALK